MSKPLNNVRISEEELYALRMKIRQSVEGEMEALSPEMEKSNVYPKELWDIGKKLDLFRMTIPVQYGGMGLCYEQWFTIMEEIGRGNSAIRMFFHQTNGLGWEVLGLYGPEQLKNKYLPLLAKGDYFGSFALTEPDCGSGADIQTTAVKDGDNWVLNGTKTLISFTDIADCFFTIAVTDDKNRKNGLTAFFVPADTPGLVIDPMPHMMGCRGTGHAHLRMKNMIVPDSYRIGPVGEGLNQFLHALAISRASIGVCLLGMCQRFLEMAIARANDRVTFGKKIIQRQAIQQTIADMATRVYTLRLLAHECAKQIDNGEDIEMISSMLKLEAIDSVRIVSDSCLEIFGGIGYFEDNPYGPVERMYRDARAMWFEEGPRTVQRLTLVRDVIAKKGEMRKNNYQ